METRISSAGMLNRKEVRKRRRALKMSFRDAAVAAGWTEDERARWQRLETGTPKDPALSTVEAVARALGCTVCDLLTAPRNAKPRTKGM